MCGITGIVGLAGERFHAPIESMTLSLKHRGPDDGGVISLAERGISLGMRRLAVIDLAGGHQPMTDSSGRYSIVFNGEIYNARKLRNHLHSEGAHFSTDHSDTEVLLQAFAHWGTECFERLRGMFAVAIWDNVSQMLSLARDPLGKKPLYIFRSEEGLLFASELKALFKHPSVRRGADIAALNEYLAFGFTINGRSLLSGVSKLAPGGYLQTTAQGIVRESRYWQASASANPVTDESIGLSSLDASLRTAVNTRLQADVPVGLFLSGGLDSTTIGYYMAEDRARDIKSFSVSFEEAGFDESRYSRMAASHLGTEHFEHTIDGTECAEIVRQLPFISDDPIADSSIIAYTALSRLARQHVTVALGGDGSDELLMGYRSFLPLRLASQVQGLGLPVGLLRRVANRWETTHGGVGSRKSNFIQLLDSSTAQQTLSIVGPASGRADTLLHADAIQLASEAVRSDIASFEELCPAENALDRMVLTYVNGYLVDDILTKVDRASMSASLEVRSPFLDLDVVQTCLGMSHDLRLRRRTQKYILKRLMTGKIPAQLIDRRKAGFAVPMGSWLRGPLGEIAKTYLAEDCLAQHNSLHSKRILRLRDEHNDRLHDHSRLLWPVLQVIMWADHWGLSL